MSIVFFLERPGDERYPDGRKRIEVPANGHVELIGRGRPAKGRRGWPRRPFLFEIEQEERAERLKELGLWTSQE